MLSIWYDNLSGNTGDLAIGISLKKLFPQAEFGTTGTVIVGGGLLLRKPTPFFDKFKVPGNHILNCVGIYKHPLDLHYLKDYKYLSVRSSRDKQKLTYLDKDVKVVPCTTMLLTDEHDFIVKPNAVGIQLLPNVLFYKDGYTKFVKWANQLVKNGFNLYFIPIIKEKDVYDERGYLSGLSGTIEGSIALPYMSPLEIFSFIGKMKFMISCSLHGGIFAYVHNIPFILYDRGKDDKTKYFMIDRNLQSDLFYNVDDIIRLFNIQRDYSSSIINDKKILEEHLYNIKCLI